MRIESRLSSGAARGTHAGQGLLAGESGEARAHGRARDGRGDEPVPPDAPVPASVRAAPARLSFTVAPPGSQTPPEAWRADIDDRDQPRLRRPEPSAPTLQGGVRRDAGSVARGNARPLISSFPLGQSARRRN